MDEKSCKSTLSSALPRPFQENLPTSSLYSSPFTSSVNNCIDSTSNPRTFNSPRCHLPFINNGDYKSNFNNIVLKSPPKQKFKPRQTYRNNFNNNTKSNFYCDPCNCGFNTEEEKNKHLNEHVQCWLDDCQFVAHIKIVQKHIKMQHETNLIHRMGNLDTPEDIQKWREERKKNFPTKQKQEENKNKPQPKVIESNKRRFGRGRNRGNFTQINSWPPKTMPSDWPFPRGQQRGRHRRGKWNRSRGTHKNIASEEPKIKKIIPNNPLMYFIDNGDDDDDETPDEIPIEKSNQIILKSTEETPQLTGALASLVADYASSNDDETPQKIQPIESTKKKINLKKKRRNRKEIVNKEKFQPKYDTRTCQISLLQQLLAPDIRNERDLIFQCVQYVVKNNFFD